MSKTAGRIGVDVGGTFTDVVAVEDGTLAVEKVPSTPAAPEEGVLAGLEAADSADARVAHATTVATNAVLERSWADVALVTTAGFRDVLEIGRQDRPDIYELHGSQPPPVVPREHRYGVPERLDERGRVLEPLEEGAVEAVGTAIADSSVEAVAVSLLFSFESPAHERRVADIFEAAGVTVPITCSSAVLPEIREYERTATTVLNAALTPVVGPYLRRLERGIEARSLETPLSVMQSGGGLARAAAVADRPVTTLLSGPAAGALGAAHVAERSGQGDALTMDMGGTSCDVALVTGGSPTVSTSVEVGGYPVAVPMVDVHTVGTGGGSVAWVDEGGALRVGPRSAGADPGPVCYGRGGSEPTVTDAQYLRGLIDPSHFASDALEPDPDAVRAAMAPIAEALDRDIDGAARGVLSVATATVERALRRVSVERGVDPRSITLVAFGGAGPLQAAAVGRSLDVNRVVVPQAAGVLSAFGLLASDRVHDVGETAVRPWSAIDPRHLAARLESLEERAMADLEDVPPERRRVEHTLELRYAGQSHTLRIPVNRPVDLEAVETRFHERHAERYGHAAPNESIELETLRVRAIGETDAPTLGGTDRASSLADARIDTAGVVLEETPTDVPVYERPAVPTETLVDGPVLFVAPDHTAFVPPAWTGSIDAYGSLVLEGAS